MEITTNWYQVKSSRVFWRLARGRVTGYAIAFAWVGLMAGIALWHWAAFPAILLLGFIVVWVQETGRFRKRDHSCRARLDPQGLHIEVDNGAMFDCPWSAILSIESCDDRYLFYTGRAIAATIPASAFLEAEDRDEFLRWTSKLGLEVVPV